jgi:copper chaperone
MNKLIYIVVLFAFVACQTGKQNSDTEKVSVEKVEMVETTFNISGMHCDNCVVSVTKGINELEGVGMVNVSLSDSNAVVEFDPSKLQLSDIEKAIEKRGYTIKK